MTDQFATCDDTPEVDMELLFQYCRDSALFPTQLLHTNGMGDMWQGFVKNLMAVDPRERPSAADALNSICFTEHDLEMLRNQLGLLFSVDFRSAAITVILESEPGVFVAILNSFGGTTIQELHRKATDMGFLEVVWLVGGTALETYFEGDLSSLQLPSWYGQIDMIEAMQDCTAPSHVWGEISRGQRVLGKAAANGYLDVVKLLIAQGAGVNAPSQWDEGLTALQGAALNGHVDVVKLLIAQGADVNSAIGAEGNPTPLKAAAQNGHVHVIKLLIAHGADPNKISGWYGSLTALQAAAEKGRVDAIKVLLSHGANVGAIYRGQAALHHAAREGQVDAIRVLLAYGADVQANHHGWTALHDAAEKGHVDAIKVLLTHGADFDEEDKGWPALQTAVVYGQVDAIKVLLAHGAEVGGEDSGGAALHETVMGVTAPAKVNIPRRRGLRTRAARRGGTALHEAAGSAYDLAKVNFRLRQFTMGRMMLVDYREDVQEGRKRWTPLQLAATNGHPEAIAVLLAHRSNMVRETGATADMTSG